MAESPIPMMTDDPQLERDAAAYRGTRSIMQRVSDAARAKGDAAYRLRVQRLLNQLDDAELIARYEYEIPETRSRVSRRWRQAQRQARKAGHPTCARLRQPRI